jgi:hypothetical protein
MARSLSSVLRALSVSSMRSRNVPPVWRAYSQLKRAVRAPPTWRYPVGDGANRTRGGASGSDMGHEKGKKRQARRSLTGLPTEPEVCGEPASDAISLHQGILQRVARLCARPHGLLCQNCKGLRGACGVPRDRRTENCVPRQQGIAFAEHPLPCRATGGRASPHPTCAGPTSGGVKAGTQLVRQTGAPTAIRTPAARHLSQRLNLP